MDSTRLDPHLRGVGRVQGSRPVVHVAQTARSETHSGLLPVLEDAEGRQPRRDENQEPG